MKNWKITIGQVVSVPLDIKKNTDKALDLMDQCISDKSSLLVLPELYLSGYEIKDFISSPSGAESIKKDVATALTRIADKTQESGCDILISYPLFRSESDKPYIALDYYSKGRSIASHRKINLCNYAQYTEHLTFSEGDQVTVADAPCCKAGMFVCEDLWHVTNAIFAAKLGAEVLFYPSAYLNSYAVDPLNTLNSSPIIDFLLTYIQEHGLIMRAMLFSISKQGREETNGHWSDAAQPAAFT